MARAGVALLGAVLVAGQRQQVFNVPTLAAASPDVTTTSFIPKYPGNVVPLGEVLTVVSTFVNTGEQPLNISFIIGSLNNVQNFAIYYQNTTVSQVGEVVEPGMEFALEYRFYPAIPEPMELRAAFSVFYEDGEQYFTTTFFNETLHVVSKGGVVDDARRMVTRWMPYALGLAVSAVGVWFVAGALGCGRMVRRFLAGKPSKKRTVTADAGDSAGFGSAFAGAPSSGKRSNKKLA